MAKIFDLLKVKLGFKAKRLEAPIIELSFEDRIKLLEQVLKKSNSIDDINNSSLFEIIDSFPEEYQVTLRERIPVFLFYKRKKSDFCEKLSERLMLRYSSPAELSKYLCRNYTYSSDFLNEAILKVAPKLSSVELINIISHNFRYNLSDVVTSLVRKGNINLDDLENVYAYREICDKFRASIDTKKESIKEKRTESKNISIDVQNLSLDDIEKKWDFNEKDALKDFVRAMLYKLHSLSIAGSQEQYIEDYVTFLNLLQKHGVQNLEVFLKSSDGFFSPMVDSVDMWKKIYQGNPNIVFSAKYYDFSLEELESIFDYAKDSDGFKSCFLKRLFDVEYLDFEKIKKYLNYIVDYSFSNKRENYSQKIDIRNKLFENVIEIAGTLDDKHKMIFLKDSDCMFQLFLPLVRDMNADKVDNMLTTLGIPQNVMDMYHSISAKQVQELKKKGIIPSETMPKDIQLSFLKNLGNIVENSELLERMKENNPNLLYTMNYQLLNFLDLSQLDYFSKYFETNRIYFEPLIGCKDEIKQMISLISNNIEYPEEYIFRLLKNASQMGANGFLENFQQMSLEEMTYYYVTKEEFFVNSLGCSTYVVENFQKSSCDWADKIIEDPNSNCHDVLSAYTRRFFGITIEQASDLVNQYGKDVEKLIHIYKHKEELSTLENIELSSIEQLRYLKELLQVKDVSILKEAYKELKDRTDLEDIDYLELLTMEESIKRAYTREKIPQLYQPQETDLKSNVEYNGVTIPVYIPRDNWNMLVTVKGAYVKDNEAYENPKEEWNSREKNVSHEICTSIIGNDNLSMAIAHNHSIRYGFYKIAPESIERESFRDIGSNSNNIEIRSASSQFMTLQNLKDNIRMGHSEHLLERRASNSENNFERQQPDYVISVNKITKAEKRAAAEFGIPIILLDTKEIAQKESKVIDELGKKAIEEYSTEKLREFIVRYHNNYAGLITLDKSAIRKYLPPQKMMQQYQNMAVSISNISDEQQKYKMALEMMRVLEEEEKKQELLEKKYIPFEFKKIKDALASILSTCIPNTTQSLINTQESISDRLVRIKKSKSKDKGGDYGPGE